ncbi:GIN domain-containing protein [Aureibaculum conchae]|uniref:GIN domain-containing protein n=1 Tax=Aureibaculum sp. 2308TA14-22 TaxID=3108392 RepID=UPI0033944DA6
MKNYSLVIVLVTMVLFPLNMSAQDKLKGNKIVTTENRYIEGFSKIETHDKIEVIITQGMEQSVTVEADENLHVAVYTEVRDSTLIIDLTKRITRKKELRVLVTIDQYIDEIITKDKSEITSSGTLKFDHLTINAEDDSKLTLDFQASKLVLNNNESANAKLTVNADDVFINADKSGKAKINLSCNIVEATIQGGSTTDISGGCSELYVNAEDRSNFKGESLESNDIIVEATDNADVQINAKKEVIISAADGAEVYIFNNPKITIEKFTDKAILRKK